MQALRSLRGRVALLATLAVALVLLIVGTAGVASFADRERERVDEALEARPVGALVRALEPLEVPAPPPGVEPAPPHGPPDLGPEALRPEGEYIRVVEGGRVLREVDAPQGLPVPEEPGVRTLRTDGES